MAIFTKQQFEAIARIKAGSRGLSSYLNESRTFSKTSIFLSHSHKDKYLAANKGLPKAGLKSFDLAFV